MSSLIIVSMLLASEVVWLKPARPGHASEIMKSLPVINKGEKVTVDYWITYYDPSAQNLLVGLQDVETLGVWFKPPAKCSLLAIAACAIASAPNQNSAKIFVATSDTTIDFVNDYNEYHGGTPSPGPSPILSFVEGPTLWSNISDTSWSWDTLWVTNPPDIGTNVFFGGWIKAPGDTSPNPRIQANVSPPYHALIWRSTPANGGPPGWYSSWHLFFISALVRMYENPPPDIVAIDKLPHSYLTTGRKVRANITDFGIPLDSIGVANVWLFYQINSGAIDSIPMSLISGDSSDGIWSAELPGISPNDTMKYLIEAIDYQGASVVSNTFSYVIHQGTAGNSLLILRDYYGPPRSPTPFEDMCNVDVWNERGYGIADSSVLHFYKDGPGAKNIICVAWGGEPIWEKEPISGFDHMDFFKSFLMSGGNLFISSQDMVGAYYNNYDTVEIDSLHFFYKFLKIHKVWDDAAYQADSATNMFGLPGDTISGAPELADFWVYPYGWVGPGYNYIGEFIELDPSCITIFGDVNLKKLGYRYEDPTYGYKLVNIYWPIQYIWKTGSGSNVVWDTTAQRVFASRLCHYFVGIEEQAKVAKSTIIGQNVPNPAVGKITIYYTIPTKQKIKLAIYDITGTMVKELVNGVVEPGIHTITWDGKDTFGNRVANGIYFYVLKTKDKTIARKGILVK